VYNGTPPEKRERRKEEVYNYYYKKLLEHMKGTAGIKERNTFCGVESRGLAAMQSQRGSADGW
jgi:hypothetical protein